MTILLLNSTIEATHFLEFRSSKYSDCVPYSTHPSAADYLNNRNVACWDVSEFVSEQKYMEIMKESGVVVSELLAKMDEAWTGEICKRLSIPRVRFFHNAYSYNARLNYIAAAKFSIAIDQLIAAEKPDAIAAFDNGLVSGLMGTDILEEQFAKTSRTRGIETCLYPQLTVEAAAELAPQEPGIDKKLLLAIKKVAKIILRPSHKFTSLPSVVLFTPFFDMAFLEKMRKVAGCHITIWPETGVPEPLPSPVDESTASRVATEVLSEIPCDFSATEGNAEAVRSLGESVRTDFIANASELLLPLAAFHDYFSKGNVRAGIWGNSSHRCAKKLIIAYLMDLGIPVFGMRHGGATEIQDMGTLMYSMELEHCTHFFSFGAEAGEILENNRVKNAPEKHFIVSGSTATFEMTPINADKPAVDVLVLVSNCANIFKGCSAMSAHHFYKRHRTLLKELDKETSLNVVAKPQRTDDAHCTVPDTLKSLKNIRVASGISLKDFLADNFTRSIILDLPSSPLCEVISLDIEVFLLREALLPFLPRAEELLAKRVHLFDNADELLAALEKWKAGALPRIRNDEFARRYVYRDNPQKNVIDGISSVINKRS